MDIQVIETERGLDLPEGIEPDLMMLIRGELLIVIDKSGNVLTRKGKTWKKAVGWTPPPSKKKAEPTE